MRWLVLRRVDFVCWVFFLLFFFNFIHLTNRRTIPRQLARHAFGMYLDLDRTLLSFGILSSRLMCFLYLVRACVCALVSVETFDLFVGYCI